MAVQPSVAYASTISRLSSQFGWRLLPAADWATAACLLDPTPADEPAERRACLSVYARVLFEACQDPARQEQAYRELYDYLCVHAAYRGGSHLACDFAQEAILLILRSFREDERARCSRPEAFLLFAKFKLWDAIQHVRRFSTENGKTLTMSELTPGEDDEDPAERRLPPDPRLQPLERLIIDERLDRARASVRLVALEVLNCLCILWAKPKPPRRQLVAAILTHLDEAPDPVIAQRLLCFNPLDSSFGVGNVRSDDSVMPSHAQIENVQVLRSLGLNKLRAALQSRMDLSPGGLL